MFGRSGSCVHNSFTQNASWTRNSDCRKKCNIQTSALGLDFINALKPVTFQFRKSEDQPEAWKMWKDEEDENGDPTGNKIYHYQDTETVMTGMLAQDVKAGLDAVSIDAAIFGGWSEHEITGIQNIADSMFVFPLINAVKELTTRVAALEDA